MRVRIDSYLRATDAAKLARGVETLWFDPEELIGVEPARLGDVWLVRWYRREGEGLFAGYALTCPKCGDAHAWTTALNCGSRGADGRCAHDGVGSCWTWTGSPEAGTLSATPSLHCVAEKGGCGWHGFLTNGVMTGA